MLIDGDWDLNTVPFALSAPPYNREVSSAPVPVIVGRSGGLVCYASQHRIASIRAERPSWVRIAIVGRHPHWQAFRNRVLDLVSAEDEGLAYAPLLHPDLEMVPSWNGPERFDMICRALLPGLVTLLDIGAYFGYMAERMEGLGKQCVAVEREEQFASVMERLRIAQKCTYAVVNEDIVSFTRDVRRFDTVLALAIFHHFIKTESGHIKLS